MHRGSILFLTSCPRTTASKLYRITSKKHYSRAACPVYIWVAKPVRADFESVTNSQSKVFSAAEGSKSSFSNTYW